MYFGCPTEYAQDPINDMATAQARYQTWYRELSAAECFDREWIMEMCLASKDADNLARALRDTFDMCAQHPYWAQRPQNELRAAGDRRVARAASESKWTSLQGVRDAS